MTIFVAVASFDDAPDQTIFSTEFRASEDEDIEIAARHALEAQAGKLDYTIEVIYGPYQEAE